MPRFEDLPADRRAVLQLLLKQGKSYDELARLLRIDSQRVRERARDAVLQLGPPGRKDELVDYLLGQQSASQQAATRSLLEESAEAGAWARGVAAELREIGAAELPEIPAERFAAPVAAGAAPRAARGEVPPLAERPVLTTPRHLHHHDFLAREAERLARQPQLGLAGLLIVAGAVFMLTVGAGGASDSLAIIGPMSTFALPVIAMIALWWEDWPGSSLRGGLSGLVDTVIIIASAVLLTMLGQIVVGHLDLKGVFEVDPGPHLAIYPATMPLAALAFATMLHLTFVWEGWPLRQLGRFRSGASALAISWIVAVVAYLLLANTDVVPPPVREIIGLHNPGGPVGGQELGAWLVCVVSWQVVFFIGLKGWPFSLFEKRAQRLVAANFGIIGGGWVTYLVLHGLLDVTTGKVAALGGCVIAAAVTLALLFEGWPAARMPPSRAREVTVGLIAAGALAIYGVLYVLAGTVDHWVRATSNEWIAIAALNFIAGSVIIHVAVWKRWPLHETMPEDGAG
jgi:hypothetical protein